MLVIVKGAKLNLPLNYRYLQSLKESKNLRLQALKQGAELWLNA